VTESSTRRAKKRTGEREVPARITRWRVGRKLERTIYEQRERHPSDRDKLLGLMETPELAAHVVALHNRLADDDR
jgi:hypothetical protein